MNKKARVIIDSAWQSFIIVISFLLFLIVIYIAAHILKPGSVDEKLSEEDEIAITFILNDTTHTEEAAVDSAISFILQRIEPINEQEAYSFRKRYSALNRNAFFAMLPQISVSTSSYFWLNNKFKYLEVIFWSIFGVLANLLYFASEAMRKRRFDVKELPVYFAKVFYTPFIVLILILSYKQLTSSGEIQFDDTSVEIIIFSFILGFFSGRAIELLDKIKNILLPGGEKEAEKQKIILTGKIIPPQDQVIETAGIEVKATSSLNENVFYSSTTDEEGTYLLELEEGPYDIRAEVTVDGEIYTSNISNRKVSQAKPTDVQNLDLIKTNGNGSTS
jgi:hypothetical protein